MRGIGAYVIIVIAIVCIWYWLSEGSTSNSYTQANNLKKTYQQIRLKM